MLRLVNSLWMLLIIVLVSVALYVSLGKHYLATVAKSPERVERYLSREFDRPVTIESIRSYWHFFSPSISIHNMVIGEQEANEAMRPLEVGFLHIGVDIFRSVLARELRLSFLHISNMHISLKHTQGQWEAIGGFGAVGSTPPVEPSAENGSVPVASSSQDDTRDLAPMLTRSLEHLLIDKGIIFKNIEFSIHSDEPTERFLVEYIALVQSATEYQLQARVEQLGGRAIGAALDVRFQGQLLQPSSWRGGFYLELDRTPVSVWAHQWAARYFPELGTLKQLDISSALWGEFSSKKLENVLGSVSLFDLKYVPDQAVEDRVLELPFAHTRFSWVGQPGGRWQLRVDQLSLEQGERAVELGPLQVFYEAFPKAQGSYDQERGSSRAQWRLQGENIPIGSLTALTANIGLLSSPWSQRIDQLKLESNVQRFELRHTGEFGHEDARWEAVAQLDAISWQAVDPLPGLTGASAALFLDQDGAVMQLSVKEGVLDFRPRFREIMPIDSLELPIKFRWSDHTFNIQTGVAVLKNPDAASAAALVQLDWPLKSNSALVQSPPRLSLLATVTDGQGGATAKYLPIKNMQPALVDWLDKAIVSGQLPAGHFLFHSALTKAPPGGRNFQMRFHTTSTTLAFHPDWPPLTAVNADAFIHGREVHVRAPSARILDADVSNVDVRLPHFSKGEVPVLDIQAKALGAIDNGITMLRETPLRTNVANFVDDLSGTGQLAVDLSMRLPLATKKVKSAEEGAASSERTPQSTELTQESSQSSATVEQQTQVDIHFQQAEVAIEKWRLAVENLEGQLSFRSGQGLSSSDLTGQLFGNRAKAEIHTSKNKSGQIVTTVTARGGMTSKALQQWHSLPIFQFLEGRADYKAQLTLFSAKSKQLPVLNIESNLKGMRVDLPVPAGKSLQSSETFSMQWDFSRPETMGVLVKNKFSLGLRRDGASFDSVHVHLGSENMVYPKDSGLIISGYSSELMLKPWLSFFERYKTEQLKQVSLKSPPVRSNDSVDRVDDSSSRGQPLSDPVAGARTDIDNETLASAASESWIDRLRWVDLQAGALGYDQTLVTDAKLQITRISDAWQLNIQADELSGLISLPLIYFTPEVVQRISEGRTSQEARDLMNASPIEADFGYLALPAPTRKLELGLAKYVAGPPRPNRALESPVLSAPPVTLAQGQEDGKLPVERSRAQPDTGVERWYRHLPPVDIEIRRLFRGSKALGRWVLSSTVVPLGIEMSTLASEFNHVSFQGSGSWLAEASGVYSQLEGQARSKQLTKTLSAFGFAPSIESSNANLDVSLKWTGAPWQFDFLDSQGVLDMRIEDGALLTANSTASSLKVIGLLNVEMLSKRMQLDFSDVLNKGMQFKLLAGRMDVKDGMLLTDNVKLRGASTQFDVSGQVNLRARTIDQEMRVTLPVSRNLVLPAAATGGLPAATAAFVIEKALGDQLDKLTTVKFRVSGDWNDPKIDNKR